MKIQTEYAKTLVDNGDYYICFKLSQYHMNEAVKFCAENCVPWEKQKTFDIEVKEHKEKRSKNANSYLWALLDQLAEKVGNTKEEVYKFFVADYGIFRDFTLEPEQVGTFRHAWEMLGVGWPTEVVDEAQGRTIVRAYYGTSQYNSKQFSRLLNAVVDECRGQGIETMTPAELESLTERWGRC